MNLLVVFGVLLVVWTIAVLLIGRHRRAQQRRGQDPRRRTRQEEPEVPPGQITGTTTGFN